MNIHPKSTRSRLIFACLVALAIALATYMAGCDYPPPKTTEISPPTYTPEPTEPPLPAPEKPTMDQSGGLTVDAGSQIPITANSNGAVEFQWKLQGIGEISAESGSAIFYVAPEFDGGDAILTVIAYNSQGLASPETALLIKVNPAPVTLEKLEITTPQAGAPLTPNQMIDCRGTYELSYGTDTTGIYVWILFGDVHGNYYLQNPPVSFKDDGTWETTILPGKGLTKIFAVKVTEAGNDVFKKMVENGEFGAFTELQLPEGIDKLYEADIQS